MSNRIKTDTSSRTFIGSVVCVDLVGYSKRSVAQQGTIKAAFNKILLQSLKGVPLEDRIVLDTGDGAAISFLGDPEVCLAVGLKLREACDAAAAALGCADVSEKPVRIGINLGPVKLAVDMNGHPNIIGDGINVAERICGFANPGQVVVSRQFHDIVSRISDDHAKLFHYEGQRTDKNVREHEIYSVQAPVEPEPAPVAAKAPAAKAPPAEAPPAVAMNALAQPTPGGDSAFSAFLRDPAKFGIATAALLGIIALMGWILANRASPPPETSALAPPPPTMPAAPAEKRAELPKPAMPEVKPAPIATKPEVRMPDPKPAPPPPATKPAEVKPELKTTPPPAPAKPLETKPAETKVAPPPKAPEAKVVPPAPPPEKAKPVEAKPEPKAKPAEIKPEPKKAPEKKAEEPRVIPPPRTPPAQIQPAPQTAPIVPPTEPVPPVREEPRPAPPVAAPTQDATPVTRAPVNFPVAAITRGIERGTVRARLTINAAGNVTAVQIVSSDPPRVFDREATKSLEEWKFNPGANNRAFDVVIEFKR